MSTSLEDTILEKVHSLDDEQQKQVLEFVENLEQNESKFKVLRRRCDAGPALGD